MQSVRLAWTSKTRGICAVAAITRCDIWCRLDGSVCGPVVGDGPLKRVQDRDVHILVHRIAIWIARHHHVVTGDAQFDPDVECIAVLTVMVRHVDDHRAPLDRVVRTLEPTGRAPDRRLDKRAWGHATKCDLDR